MKLISVAGARPNFMKVTPIIRAIKRHNSTSGGTNIGGTPLRVAEKLYLQKDAGFRGFRQT